MNWLLFLTVFSGTMACKPEQCPSSNADLVADCEPTVPACEMGLEPRSAESYRGTFGSLSADGSCQSQWPEPILAACTEPLPEGVPDLRGLWADAGHVERIEQCGERVVVTSSGIITIGMPD